MRVRKIKKMSATIEELHQAMKDIGMVLMTEEEAKVVETHRFSVASDGPFQAQFLKDSVQKTKGYYGDKWDSRYTNLEVVSYPEDGKTGLSFWSPSKLTCGLFSDEEEF